MTLIDNKQGGDTIVMMERVREAIVCNVELADKSTWLWFTSEKMGFSLRLTGGGEHKERTENLDNRQGVCDHLVAYHLKTVITDFIKDKIQVCYNNDPEQTLNTVNGVKRSTPRSKNQHIIHSLSTIQLTRNVRSSCGEACWESTLITASHMTLVSFSLKRH